MIIQICQNQPDLALRIAQPGCSGQQLIDYESVRMVIRAPHCPCLLKSPIVRDGCWLYNEPIRPENILPHELPAIVYDAFSVNDDGEIVFKFDALLWRMPPGRYIGHVEFKNGCPIVQVDIDLCSRPYIVDRATPVSRSCYDI